MPHPSRRRLARCVLCLCGLLLAAPALPAWPAAPDATSGRVGGKVAGISLAGTARTESQRTPVGKPGGFLPRNWSVEGRRPAPSGTGATGIGPGGGAMATGVGDGRAPLTRTGPPGGSPRQPAVEALGLVGLVGLAGVATALPIVALEPRLARRRRRLPHLPDPGDADPGW